MKTNFIKTKIKNILLEIKFLRILKQTAFILMWFWISFIIVGWLMRISLPTNTIINNELIEKVEAKEFVYSKKAKKADLEAIKNNHQRYLKKQRKVIHLWIPKNDERQKWINYAYKISWYNKDFILTLTAENYRWTTTRKSNRVWANWWSDYWICQVNAWYHPEILSWKSYYPNKEYFAKWFLNPYKQIDYCWKLYKWWTKFYGYNVRYKIKNSLKFN